MNIKYKYTDEMLKEAVKNNLSLSGVMRELGIKWSSGSHYHLSKRIKLAKINTSHFTGRGHLKGKTHNWTKKIPLEKLLIKSSQNRSRHNIKRRLITSGLKKNVCEVCQIDSWNNVPLIMHLDHINGNPNDNRIENLRMICPNCHSQTKTYSGKNIKK